MNNQESLHPVEVEALKREILGRPSYGEEYRLTDSVDSLLAGIIQLIDGFSDAGLILWMEYLHFMKMNLAEELESFQRWYHLHMLLSMAHDYALIVWDSRYPTKFTREDRYARLERKELYRKSPRYAEERRVRFLA